jgi:hypothetical protein
MCSFKFFNQNVCTVNVHEMYYKFNPGPSPYAMGIWDAHTMHTIDDDDDEIGMNK